MDKRSISIQLVMRTKALFFDIDGTLINNQGEWPDSSKKAVDLVRAGGHKLFLCTGRNEVQIYPMLKDYGFDGIVSAAGATVTCGGKEIYHKYVEKDPLEHCIDFFEGKPMSFGIQTASGNYMDRMSYDFLQDQLVKYDLGEKVIKAINQGMHIVKSVRGHEDVQKLFYFESPEPISTVQAALGDYFLVLESSLPIPGRVGGAGEIMVRGTMKSTGMEHAIRYFGIAREDTIAFGDAPNDIDMLRFAGTGVAMGNAKEEVKAVADLVTGHIDEDGIYRALKELELI